MALQPKATLCLQDLCKTLVVPDITGPYSTANTGGWGVPNTTLAGATSAEITIILPSSTSETFDVLSTVNAATIVDGRFILDTLTPSDFGSTATKFDDGIYDITYIIDNTYSYNAKIWIDCQVSYCLSKMLANFSKKMCTCDWADYYKQYQLAEAYLVAARNQFGCRDYTTAKDTLKQIQKICSILNCSC